MFQKLRTKKAPQPTVPDEILALAVLLAELARCDGVFNEAEYKEIARILVGRYSITPTEAQFVVEQANKEIDSVWEDCWDNHAYCSTLMLAIPRSSRGTLVEYFWRVGYADGDVNPYETSLVWRTASTLRVGAIDTEKARQAAAS